MPPDRLTIAAARFGLRYVYEAPTQEQQNRVLKSGLYPLGDVRLIWVNEGDLHMGTAPLPQPTLAALLAERAPEFLAAVREWHSEWGDCLQDETDAALTTAIERAGLIAQEPRTTFHLTPQQFQEMHNAG